MATQAFIHGEYNPRAFALVGAMRKVEKINGTVKLIACALMSALALYTAIAMQSFPSISFFVGMCDALIVLTMAVARTKVQLIAKQLYPAHLSSIIAARSIILKAATLFSVDLCLLVADLLSLKTTLTLLIIPIAISFVPLLVAGKTLCGRPSHRMINGAESS